jgi:hypothetical protein
MRVKGQPQLQRATHLPLLEKKIEQIGLVSNVLARIAALSAIEKRTEPPAPANATQYARNEQAESIDLLRLCPWRRCPTRDPSVTLMLPRLPAIVQIEGKAPRRCEMAWAMARTFADRSAWHDPRAEFERSIMRQRIKAGLNHAGEAWEAQRRRRAGT